jgi:biopolymer transport protein ExbD
MSSMIDVVFLLLVFFVMTFQIAVIEGEFRMTSPVGEGPVAAGPDVPPLWIRLTAGEDGRLTSIRMNDLAVADFQELRGEVARLIGPDRYMDTATEGLEVVLDCDYSLAYQHVIDAITAVRGYRDHAGNVVDLIPRLRFAPSRTP